MPDNHPFIIKDLAAGEFLFKQGEKGDFVYIIISGTVEITKETHGTTAHVAQMSSGDILGEMAILTDEPRCASASATTPTRVIKINDRALHLALVNNDLPILKPLTRQLIFRFREAEQQADYYRNKSKRLLKEVALLKQQLLHYELEEDN